MDKRDLKKELKEVYQPSAKQVTQLDVPPMRFLMVDAKVHVFIAARGSLRSKHHEIYLSDVTKADPAKWKTIIRQPFAAG